MRRFVMVLWVVALAAACDSSDGGSADIGTTPDTSAEDVVAGEDVPGVTDTTPDVAPDIPMDVAVAEDTTDTAGEDTVDVTEIPFEYPARALPFEFARPADGEPIPAADVTAFTEQVTGLWKKVGWFRWLLRTSTGMDASTGMEDYLAWYNDVVAVKAGDTVTFKQVGLDHNMWIPGSKVFSEVLNGYLLTGDWTMGKLTEQYCKGLTASVKGFVWGEDDPAPYLMARAIFPHDHTFTLDAENWQDDGRTKVVEFHEAYRDEDGWNAQSFAWPENPTWGSIWITNMRSKDDVCAIVRTTAFLPYAVEDAPDEYVRTACQETLDTMRGFNKDIVDHNYYIRTKDREGNAYAFDHEDLGNYVAYIGLDERNECPARLASDLIAYGERLTNDCGSGTGSLYDMFASQAHYYNYPIVWNYHMAALGNALVYGQNEDAWNLLVGLAERMDAYMDPESSEPGAEHHAWRRDMAVLLVQAASMGLPLTAREARHVQTHWTQAVAEFKDWPRWDLWDESVEDGQYGTGDGFRPRCSDDGIAVEALTMFMEYCNSPFRNPAGAQFVDCDIIADLDRWGTLE